MQVLTLYLTTAAVFLGLDVLMLRNVMRPLFEQHLGDALLQDLRLAPAAVFYLFYVGGVVWFASLPALPSGNAWGAFLAGALLGALAYGTYEFTNFATLRAWSPVMVAVDLAWGTVVTGLSAAAGVALVSRLFPAAG